MPRNRLARKQLTKLKIYAGPEHPHAAQQPQPMEIERLMSRRAGPRRDTTPTPSADAEETPQHAVPSRGGAARSPARPRTRRWRPPRRRSRPAARTPPEPPTAEPGGRGPRRAAAEDAPEIAGAAEDAPLEALQEAEDRSRSRRPPTRTPRRPASASRGGAARQKPRVPGAAPRGRHRPRGRRPARPRGGLRGPLRGRGEEAEARRAGRGRGRARRR